MKKFGLLILLLGTFAVFPVKASPIEIASFQVDYLGAFQAGGSAHTGQIAWTPIFDLGFVGLRGEIGFALLKNVPGDRFLAINYEAFFRFVVFPFLTAEVGGGAHSWTAGNGGTKPSVSANLALGVGAGILDRLFVGYSRLFMPTNVNELKIGVGLIF